MSRFALALFVFMLVATLSFQGADAKKCKKPKKLQTAKLVVFPALGTEIVNSGGLYNNYSGICTDCKKAGATLFFEGQPSVANADNAMVHGSLDVFCTNYSNACIKGKGGWYGVKGGSAIWDVAIYTLCNPKGKKCKNFAQLGCNLTNFDGTAGLYKLKGANVNKPKKAKWTCAQQQGATGTSPAPAISKKNKYIIVKAISCGGCKPIKKPGCKGPTVTPTSGSASTASPSG